MYISQPAVSKQVKLLEEQLGLILFDRSSGGLVLTEQGKIIFDFYDRHFIELDEVRKKAGLIQSRNVNMIRIGCLDGWNADAFFPEMSGLFRKAHPGIHVQLFAKKHTEIINGLINSEIDIGISHESAISIPQGFKSCVIGTSRSVFLISAKNPLAAKSDLDPGDLKDEPFYCVSPSNDEHHAHSTHLISICGTYGFMPNIIPVSNSSEAYLRIQQDRSGVFLTISYDRACTSSIYKAIEVEEMQNIVAVWSASPGGIIDDGLSHELERHYRNRDAEFFKGLLK